MILAGACGDRSIVVGDVLPAAVVATGGAAAPGGGAGGDGTVGAGASAVGAQSGSASSGQRAFILGADLSAVDEQEDLGLAFVDQGEPADILEILAAHGFNYVRLRLFHDPSSPCRTSAYGDQTCGYQFELATRAETYCDLEHTVAMAQRVKAMGMGLLLDFHYSDTWADPDDQNKPLAWEALRFDELAIEVQRYTRDSLRTFEAAGVLPDMVQLGNEITPGMLYPDGESGDDNWDQLVALLNAGIAGVESVSPGTRIMLHIEKPDSFATSDWWLSNLLERGVSFDILGQSCYPEWHGPAEGWPETFEQLAEKYPALDFVVAEYSAEKRAVNDMMWALPGDRGLGTFIWEPTNWGEMLLDREGDELITNGLIALYDEMAQEYGLRP